MNDEMFQDAEGVWWNKAMFGSPMRMREEAAVAQREMERTTVRIDLFRWNRGEYDAASMATDIIEALKEIPESDRDKVVFEITGSWDEDGAGPAGEMYYVRQETDAELEARKEAAKQQDIDGAARREKAERAQLARLKAKYGE